MPRESRATLLTLPLEVCLLDSARWRGLGGEEEWAGDSPSFPLLKAEEREQRQTLHICSVPWASHWAGLQAQRLQPQEASVRPSVLSAGAGQRL